MEVGGEGDTLFSFLLGEHICGSSILTDVDDGKKAMPVKRGFHRNAFPRPATWKWHPIAAQFQWKGIPS